MSKQEFKNLKIGEIFREYRYGKIMIKVPCMVKGGNCVVLDGNETGFVQGDSAHVHNLEEYVEKMSTISYTEELLEKLTGEGNE